MYSTSFSDRFLRKFPSRTSFSSMPRSTGCSIDAFRYVPSSSLMPTQYSL